jgi:hypothetical protein
MNLAKDQSFAFCLYNDSASVMEPTCGVYIERGVGLKQAQNCRYYLFELFQDAVI